LSPFTGSGETDWAIADAASERKKKEEEEA
jgi:hypothetical protein